MGIEVEIDRDLCMGSGNCMYEAPGVFDLDDDSVAFVVDPTASSEDSDRRCGEQVPDPCDYGPTGWRDADLSLVTMRVAVSRVAWRAAT